MLHEGGLEPKQAERLRGRMQWFEGYAFGRTAQHSLRVLGEISLKKQRYVSLSDHERVALEFLVKRVSEAEAITLSPICLDTLLVFTDGACEGENEKHGSIGGVIVHRTGQCYQHFSCVVPLEFMNAALSESANPIYELELLPPVHVAISLWGDLLRSAHTVFFTWTTMQPGQPCAKVAEAQNLDATLSNASWKTKAP